jgi:hypothetical protein
VAAGPHDDQQAIVHPVEDRVYLGAPAQDHLGVLVAQRELSEELARSDQRHDPLDALVADVVVGLEARGGHLISWEKRREGSWCAEVLAALDFQGGPRRCGHVDGAERLAKSPGVPAAAGAVVGAAAFGHT